MSWTQRQLRFVVLAILVVLLAAAAVTALAVLTSGGLAPAVVGAVLAAGTLLALAGPYGWMWD